MRKKTKRHRHLRYLTLSALFVALSVVMLYFGRLVDVLSLSAAGLASLLMLFFVLELPLAYRLFLYFGTSLLTFLLVPGGECALLYLSFGGLYPMLKFPCERLGRWPSFFIKLAYVNLLILLSEVATVFLFTLPPSSFQMLLPLFLVGNLAFFLYDKLLSRLLVDYMLRLRPRIARYL